MQVSFKQQPSEAQIDKSIAQCSENIVRANMYKKTGYKMVCRQQAVIYQALLKGGYAHD